MKNDTDDTILRRWGRWAAGLTLDAVPARALAAARYQILDTLAAALAGARSEESSCIAGGIAGFAAGGGRSTVLSTATRAAPHDAAVANAAYSMCQDFDNIIWMGHTCHSAVFASLAVAEHEGSDASQMLAAVVVANEIGGRLGATSFLGPLNGQMWTFVHLVGAAAAAAKLLGLDAERTTHALAIALAQPNFALQPGFLTPSSKLLAASTPTAAGIQAAYFARSGMTGEARLIEDPRGFWKRFSYLPLAPMAGELGSFWAIETLTIKTFPGCHYFQTACTAVERLLARTGRLRPDEVDRIDVETTKLAIEASRFASEYASLQASITPVNAAFDLKVTLAILLIAGRLTSEEVHPGWLTEHSEAIHHLRDKITVRHAPELTLQTLRSARAVGAGDEALRAVTAADLVRLARRFRDEYRSTLFRPQEILGWIRAIAARRPDPGRPSGGGDVPLPFPARVSLVRANGQRDTERVDLPVGSLCHSGFVSALERKFITETAASIGEDNARAAWRIGLDLENHSVSDLARAVCSRRSAE